LPKECLENKTWRKKVITTLFRWAGVQSNPWVIPDTKIVDALQKICTVYCGTSIGISITVDSNFFSIVRCYLHPLHETDLNLQASQRLSDSWRSTFGSSAIAILNAFFDTHDRYRDSDEMRQTFAKHALNKFRFIYRRAKGENSKVQLLVTRAQILMLFHRNSRAYSKVLSSFKHLQLTSMQSMAPSGLMFCTRERCHRSPTLPWH
jgi:hypothetical protein